MRFNTRTTYLSLLTIARVWRVVLVTLLVAVNAPALERPSPAELAQLRLAPAEFTLRQQRAALYGNHQVSPALIKHASDKMAVLAKGGDPRAVPPPDWQGMPTAGTNKVLIFLIDFPDYVAVNSFDTITNKLFGAGIPADFPLESLTQFYQRSSYGQLTIEGTTLGWYRMAHNRNWYTDTYGTGNLANYQIIKEVAEHFDGDIDYSQFDNNGDGKIDYFAVLWAGPDNGWANFWWGYQWELQTVLTLDAVRFYKFSWQWESNPRQPPYSAAYSPRVIIHETGHALGLPDYYDYDGSVGADGGVGGMDMMDSGLVDHNCFSKFMLDWVVPTVVTNDLDDFPLRTAADYPDAVALAHGYTGSDPYAEYFMVQNRQAVSNDLNLPGAGLAIWHVNAGLDAGGSDFAYNNSYTTRKLLMLVQADGLAEIENGGGGSADYGDFYVAGKIFTPESSPDSRTYAGVNTEVRVTDISASGALMTADFSAEDNRAVVVPSPVHIVEGETTNVAVTLLRMPASAVSVTVAYLSGSSNFSVVGSSTLSFTTNDWNVPQELVFASALDGDEAHDLAVFRLHDYSGGVLDTDVVLQQGDVGDTVPPTCVITSRVNGARSEVTFTLTFNESVQGFELDDILTSDNIAGDITVFAPTDISGLSTQYEVRVACPDVWGAITLTIPPGALTDLGGNPNPEYLQVYTLPCLRTDFLDDFDALTSVWSPSTNDYQTFTTVGWKWGPPVFNSNTWFGPVAAYSGSNCWGTMDGPYAKRLDGWIESPVIHVGAYPVLRFMSWVGSGANHVEVNNGVGWYDLTPGGVFAATSIWEEQVLALDDALFGNRELIVRFRSQDGSFYVDDVSVQSQNQAGVNLIAVSPTNGLSGATVSLAFSVYNSTVNTVTGVLGYVSSPDQGVSITAGSPVSYGVLAPGELSSGSNLVTMVLGAASAFGNSSVRLFQQTREGRVVLSDDVATFVVDDVVAPPASSLLTVRASVGVTNSFGEFLAGDGGLDSCLFQLIYAGSNGVADAPLANGQATGDDRLIYSAVGAQSWGRFGEGSGISPDAGRFSKIFAHNLTSNSLVYVRAWDASAFASVAAYGNSALRAVQLTTNEVLDFGAWVVNRPINYPGNSLAELSDRDGDSIPDGWCIYTGINPNRPIVPLIPVAESLGAVTGLNRPGRVAVSDKFVFIADTENSRIEIWNRSLSSRLLRFGTKGTAVSNQFDRPQGLAVNAAGTRLLVADTMNYRVSLFSVDTNSAALTYLSGFGEAGTNSRSFNTPFGVTFAAGDAFYVADSHPSLTCNYRVQSFAAMSDTGTVIGGVAGTGGGLFNRPLGVGVGSNGVLFVADSGNSLIQAFLPDGSVLWEFGGVGTNPGTFKQARDVSVGIGGRVYVADTVNNRIQVVDVSAGPAIGSLGVFGVQGSLAGQFRVPQGVAPALNDGSVYVADTYNNRVQKLRLTFDGDGDGMDDVWEDLHGLDSHDPLDAFADPDGDGVINIGEYRLGTDPQNSDSNGNGESDGWELAHGVDPLAVTLEIARFTAWPALISWVGVEGGVYEIQTTTNLVPNIWGSEGGVTSPVAGYLTWTNSGPQTNSVKFYRVKWMNVP